MTKDFFYANTLSQHLQKAAQILDAAAVGLWLAVPETQELNLVYQNPAGAEFNKDQVAAALAGGQNLHQSLAGGGAGLYIPIIIYESLVLGVLAFQFRPGQNDPKNEAIAQLLADQMAALITNQRLLQRYEAKDQERAFENAQLLKVYEAISLLEPERQTEDYIELAAHTYYNMGWRAVRISLLGPEAPPPVIISDPEMPIWDTNTDEWKKRSLELGQRWGNATLLRGVQGLDVLELAVLQADGKALARVELFQLSDQLRLTEENTRPLMILAHQLGNTLERQRLIHSLRQSADLFSEKVEELEFMRNADREISSKLDSERIAQFTLDWAMRRTGADVGLVVVVDPVSQELSIKESIGYPDQMRQEVYPNKQRGILGRCLRTQQIQVVEDVQRDPDYVAAVPKMVTELAVPLISNKRLIGAIALESRNPGRFDDNAVQFVDSIANMTAVALDNAQLLQQAEQLADDLSIIYNAGRTISSSLQLEKTIQSVAQGMALAVKGADALIFAYEASNHTAKLLSYYLTNTSQHQLPSINSIMDIHHYPRLNQAIEQNQILILNQLSPDSNTKTWFQNLGYEAAAITPLAAQGNVVGMAFLLKEGPEADFAPSEIFVVESLATQAAGVLRQAILYTEIVELETLKSEMLRMASHDLRAPIANVNGYLELLEMDIEAYRTEDIDSYLHSIRRGLHNMETLVEDLLTLEKIESQRADSWEAVDLAELMQTLVDQQQTTAALKQQSLELAMQGPPYAVRGHRVQLGQAFNNLVGNGLKYTPEGGRVQVRAKTEGGKLLIEVEDNGYGIPQNRQNRIFQRFYRAKTPGTEHIAGSGLGLSLVKSIIERHGGQISFSSQEGQGTTFRFWLPLLPSP
jgi:signal transduction histidine kinase